MVRADALLVLQAANCNEQIPAKLYEYLRAGRPILALTDPRGDTAQVMREAGLNSIARLDATDEIAKALEDFIATLQSRRARLPLSGYVAQCSRQGRAAMLAQLLEHASDRRSQAEEGQRCPTTI
jgi:hypothetical protein